MKSYFSILLFTLTLLLFGGCTKDSCMSSNCKNGGYCANGDCVCKDGYSGADCSQQKTPNQIRITKIEVIRFPGTEANGAGWDLTSGPDIFPQIKLGNNVVWTSGTFFQNANPAYNFEFIPNPIISLSSPNSQYTISLFDYDDIDADDFMGGINFVPYHSTNNFPSILSIDAGGAVAFRLHVNYAW